MSERVDWSEWLPTPIRPMGLPGESEPLAMRYAGEPITPDEALGVARRHHMRTLSQRVAAKNRGVKNGIGGPVEVPEPPDELPSPHARAVPAAYRLPPRLLAFVRAKAEMENRTVTDVIVEALQAYIAASPGAKVQYRVAKRPGDAPHRGGEVQGGADSPD